MPKTDLLRKLYARVCDDPFWKRPDMGAVFVPGLGSLEDQGLVLLGEAPGADEERVRQPFVGAAGRNLTQLLHEIGLTREDVYITNLVKFRPVNRRGANRSPRIGEQQHAVPFLMEELRILGPRLVVCLGLPASRAILGGSGVKMNEVNGKSFHRHHFLTMVTYHPSPLNTCNPARREALHSAFSRIRDFLER
ncbi:MAG: uracil-DNA glycosylase [Syntrophobacteraceae bacterium]|jgi:DNA polymerase|nr:uracil-DNA glycosylase [Syntrophobacteraceae bacterium]